MKKNILLLGLLVFTGLVVVQTVSAQIAFDKTPKAETAVLYYDESIAVTHVNGVQAMLGPLARTFYGKGTNVKPKAVVRIPAGEQTLTLYFKPADYWGDTAGILSDTGLRLNRKGEQSAGKMPPLLSTDPERIEKYTFLPGRNYQIKQIMDIDAFNRDKRAIMQNNDASRDKGAAAIQEAMKAQLEFEKNADSGKYHKLIIVDITK